MESFFTKCNNFWRGTCVFNLRMQKWQFLSRCQSTFYVTQWIIPPEQVTNPPAICNPLPTSDDCSANLLSTDLFIWANFFSPQCWSTPRQSHENETRYSAPSFPRPSSGKQCLLTAAGGVVVDWRRGHFTVSLFILFTGFLVLESWLGKSLYSSPIFQGVKRWACSSFKQQCNV